MAPLTAQQVVKAKFAKFHAISNAGKVCRTAAVWTSKGVFRAEGCGTVLAYRCEVAKYNHKVSCRVVDESVFGRAESNG